VDRFCIRIAIDDRVPLVLSVDNMNASVSGRESLNGAAEPGRDLLEMDVFDGTKSVRAMNRCNDEDLLCQDSNRTGTCCVFREESKLSS
jgi:hypothetical protein